MNNQHSRILTVLAFLSVACFLAAQNTDQKILGIESGVSFGYDLSTGNIGNANTVALNLTLTENLTAGFLFLTGTAPMPVTANLLSLNYGLADRFGFSLVLGRDTGAGNLLTGFGAYFNLFERKLQDAIATALKVKIDYIFPPSVGVSSGDLTMGLSVSVGL